LFLPVLPSLLFQVLFECGVLLGCSVAQFSCRDCNLMSAMAEDSVDFDSVFQQA
jgi:hypothetical protein